MVSDPLGLFLASIAHTSCVCSPVIVDSWNNPLIHEWTINFPKEPHEKTGTVVEGQTNRAVKVCKHAHMHICKFKKSSRLYSGTLVLFVNWFWDAQ